MKKRGFLPALFLCVQTQVVFNCLLDFFRLGGMRLPAAIGIPKDIADFQDSVFYLSADAPVEYSRANLEQICVQKEFIPKTKVVPNHATLLSLMDREDSAAIMDLWCQPIYDKKFKYVRLEATVPIVGAFRKNCAHAKIIRMLYETLAERYGEEVMIIIRK